MKKNNLRAIIITLIGLCLVIDLFLVAFIPHMETAGLTGALVATLSIIVAFFFADRGTGV